MKTVFKAVEQDQTKDGAFKTYYDNCPSNELEVSLDKSIESPGFQSLIIEELIELKDESLGGEIDRAVISLLSQAILKSGTYVWRFNPTTEFNYPVDNDDTAVAQKAIILLRKSPIFFNPAGLDILLYHENSWLKDINNQALWLSENEQAIPTFTEKIGNSIDPVVNANILNTYILIDEENEEHKQKIKEGIANYLKDCIRKISNTEMSKISKYYLYNSFFTYQISKIQKEEELFEKESIDTLKEISHNNLPKNTLDAALSVLTLKNLDDQDERLNAYLKEKQDNFAKPYALFRRIRGNIYFASPALNSLLCYKAVNGR